MVAIARHGTKSASEYARSVLHLEHRDRVLEVQVGL